MKLPFSKKPDRVSAIDAARAGVAGALIYVGVMEVDRRAFSSNTDDLLLVGGIVTRNARLARALGFGAHLGFGAAFGLAYAKTLEGLDASPSIASGVAFALAENTVLYPLALLQILHPAIRSGQLDRYWTWTALLQGILRHTALGAVMGELLERD